MAMGLPQIMNHMRQSGANVMDTQGFHSCYQVLVCGQLDEAPRKYSHYHQEN